MGSVSKSRGSVELTLGERTFDVTPTHKLLDELETRVGRLMSFWLRAGQGDYALGEVVSFIFVVLKHVAPDKERNVDKVYDLVLDEGVIKCSTWCVEFLTAAFSGAKKKDETATGEEPAPAT